MSLHDNIDYLNPWNFSMIIYIFDLGTSHCVDMYANEPGDPEDLVAARAKIGELVNKWVNEAN